MLDKTNHDLAKYRIEKARTCLATADIVYNTGDYVAALNRSYYAIFNAIRSVFAIDGVDRKKHSGVIACFQQNYVKQAFSTKNIQQLFRMLLR